MSSGVSFLEGGSARPVGARHCVDRASAGDDDASPVAVWRRWV